MTRGIGAVEALQALFPEWLVAAFAALTHLGDVATFVVVLSLVYWLGERYDLFERRDDGALLVGVALGALGLVVALKALFALGRPPEALMAVSEDGNGFPSGHALGSTAIWGGLAALLARGRRRSRFAVAAVVVGVVALSRVVIGVHYLVDVVVGVAVGAAYLAVALRVADGRPDRAFALAAAIGVVALAVDVSVDAAMAFGGAVGGYLAWRAVDRSGAALGHVPLPVAAVAVVVLGGVAAATLAFHPPLAVAVVANAGVAAGLVGLPAVAGSSG